MKFYKVVTKITDRKDFIYLDGCVEAETRPENEYTETRNADTYVDYFPTKEAAEMFVRTQRRVMFGR